VYNVLLHNKSSLLRNNIVTGRGWWKEAEWLCEGAVLVRECDQPSISIYLCLGPCKLFLSPAFKTVKKIVCKTLHNCIALYQEALCPWAFCVIDFNMFFLGLFSTILKNIICASSMHVLLLILWYAFAPWYSKEINNLKKTSPEIGKAVAKDPTSSGSPVVYWSVLCRQQLNLYPPCNSPSEHANTFAELFSDKITKIRVDLDAAAPIHPVPKINRVCS